MAGVKIKSNLMQHIEICLVFNPSVKKDMDNYFLVEGNIADLCSRCPGET